MGDEDLDLEATNEVESDKKDSALWAKARALAKGNQETAKYLYVKLKAEKLAKNREEVEGAADSVITSTSHTDTSTTTKTLDKCYECGKDVSDTAATCPHCGAINPTNNKQNEVKFNAAIFTVVIIFAFYWAVTEGLLPEPLINWLIDMNILQRANE